METLNADEWRLVATALGYDVASLCRFAQTCRLAQKSVAAATSGCSFAALQPVMSDVRFRRQFLVRPSEQRRLPPLVNVVKLNACGSASTGFVLRAVSREMHQVEDALPALLRVIGGWGELRTRQTRVEALMRVRQANPRRVRV